MAQLVETKLRGQWEVGYKSDGLRLFVEKAVAG